MTHSLNLFIPKNTSEIYGQEFAVQKIKDFILNFSKQKKKAAIIYGPPGTGKTCSIYAIAKELNLELLEINASDYRNSENIDSIIKPAISQKSLFSSSKLIFIDEIDGFLGTQDYGGIQALASLIESSKFPIVMAANDPWSSKLSSLRSKSNLIECPSINYLVILKALKNFANKLAIKYDEDSIKAIAINANGDLRAALNDFYALSIGRTSIKPEDIKLISSRNKKESIFKSLSIIFKTKNTNEVLNSIFNTDIDLDEASLWIDENLPLEYSNDDLKKAYNALSRADVFKGRIIRQQYYRLMVYQGNLMTAGVSFAKSKDSKNYIPYKRTGRILKYWIAKNKYSKRKTISEKISKATHSSTKKVLKDTLPYFKVLFRKNKSLGIAASLGLNEEEIEYLTS